MTPSLRVGNTYAFHSRLAHDDFIGECLICVESVGGLRVRFRFGNGGTRWVIIHHGDPCVESAETISPEGPGRDEPVPSVYARRNSNEARLHIPATDSLPPLATTGVAQPDGSRLFLARRATGARAATGTHGPAGFVPTGDPLPHGGAPTPGQSQGHPASHGTPAQLQGGQPQGASTHVQGRATNPSYHDTPTQGQSGHPRGAPAHGQGRGNQTYHDAPGQGQGGQSYRGASVPGQGHGNPAYTATQSHAGQGQGGRQHHGMPNPQAQLGGQQNWQGAGRGTPTYPGAPTHGHTGQAHGVPVQGHASQYQGQFPPGQPGSQQSWQGAPAPGQGRGNPTYHGAPGTQSQVGWQQQGMTAPGQPGGQQLWHGAPSQGQGAQAYAPTQGQAGTFGGTHGQGAGRTRNVDRQSGDYYDLYDEYFFAEDPNDPSFYDTPGAGPSNTNRRASGRDSGGAAGSSSSSTRRKHN